MFCAFSSSLSASSISSNISLLSSKHFSYKFAVTDGRKIQDALPNVTDIDLIEWATWTDNAVEMRDKLLKRYYSQ